MAQALPIGLPFFYSKEDNFKSMLATDSKNWSYECLDFLNYLSYERFGGKKIQCVITGEKKILTDSGPYHIDGYIEHDGKKYFIEYQGCRFHVCPYNCGTTPLSDTRLRDERKLKSLQKLGTVLRITSCKWSQLKKTLDYRKSPFSKFFYQPQISEFDLINAIKNGEFYGFAEISIDCPAEVKEKWSIFPPIFKKYQPEWEKLCDEIKPFFHNTPSEQLTCAFSAKNITMNTDMLKFLMDEGFIISNLNWALEYQRGCFFAIFSEI